MNMSDDLVSTTLQVSTKVVETGTHVVDKTMDIIAKLLQMLANKNRSNRNSNVKATDLTDIKSGEVNYNKLRENAMATGDTITVSKNGFTKSDMEYIAKKAKDYGIPVAFTNKKNKDNIFANVRTSDLEIYKNICTEMMKEKLAIKPQELSNFKVNEWEIPFITNELNKHDLSAQFGKTQSGEHLCLFEKSDEKAVLIARDEFVRKCDELNKTLSFDRDEENNFTIKELHSGKEITFDNSMSQEELSDRIQKEFGFDINKSMMACAKFGEEMLSGDDKKKFFSDNPQNEFSKIDTNITLKGESVLVKPYTCWRVTPKEDAVPKIVFQDKDGNFAVLNPEKMKKSSMENVIRTQLHIDDKETINAMIDKAEKISDYYTKLNEENLSVSRTFGDDGDVVLNTYIDETDNSIHNVTIENIDTEVERTGKDDFLVTINTNGKELFNEGADKEVSNEQTLLLSFANKKKAMKQLIDVYKSQGINEQTAKEMASEVFKKATSQSAERVLQIEEINGTRPTINNHVSKSISINEFLEAELLNYIDENDKHIHIIEPENVSVSIDRTGKNTFSITSTVTGIETITDAGMENIEQDLSKTETFVLSLENKKKNIKQELIDMYKKQGIPEKVASEIANDVVKNAEIQLAKDVPIVTEFELRNNAKKANEMTMTVKCNNKSEKIDISDSKEAVEEIKEKFDVSEEAAVTLIEKAQEKIEESEAERLNEEYAEIQTDEDNISEQEYSNYPPQNDFPPLTDSDAPPIDSEPHLPDVPDNFEVPEIEVPQPQRRR